MKIIYTAERIFEIAGVDGFAENCGPYATYADAKQDMDGMQRFFDNSGDPLCLLNESDSVKWRLNMKDTILADVNEALRLTEDAILTVDALTSTRETNDSKTHLTVCRGLLLRLKHVIEMHDYPDIVECGKKTCEEMLNRAKRALENGGVEMSNILRKHSLRLAEPIARLHFINKKGNLKYATNSDSPESTTEPGADG